MTFGGGQKNLAGEIKIWLGGFSRFRWMGGWVSKFSAGGGGFPPPILPIGKTMHIKIGVAKKGMNAAQNENLINSKFIVVSPLNI